jgi:hypothetical protein
MVTGMSASDPMLARIAAKFDGLAVQSSRGGYILTERGSDKPVARLKPFRKTDCFELFYWSLVHEHWKTFGPLGAMKLTLDEAHEIVHAEPLFRFKRKSWLSKIFG